MTVAIYYAEDPYNDDHEEIAYFTDGEGWSGEPGDLADSFPDELLSEEYLIETLDGPHAYAVGLDEDDSGADDEQQVPPGNVPGLPVVDFHHPSEYGRGAEPEPSAQERYEIVRAYWEERGWDTSELTKPDGYDDDSHRDR